MADYPISNVARRIVYTGSAGVGPYAFPFEVLQNTDIVVYKNNTLLTLTTDYTVSISPTLGTGSVTLVSAATGSDRITIVGARAVQRTSDFTTGGDLFANTLNDELDSQTIFIQQVAETAERAIKAPVTDPTNINMTLPKNTDRANKTLVFDAQGNPAIGQLLGKYRGTWTTATNYIAYDFVIDPTNDNVYICNAPHTSSGSAPIDTNADTAKWDLIVDAEAAGLAQAAAEAAQAAAELAETNAETAATNAASSASSASTSATNAATSATNAANSATSAGSSASAASSSASTASTAATNAANSATSASNSATSASTSATNAANSATSASNSATSATNSATNAASSATSAASSASSASTSATNAAASAASAASSYDSFDDRYLGAKSSPPATDNDGNAILTGALYWDTSVGQLYVWDGGAWDAAAFNITGSGVISFNTRTGAITLSSTDVTDALTYTPLAPADIGSTVQGYDADLNAIAGLSGTSGLLKKTAANTWTLDTSSYLTSYTETDPVFSASPSAGITSTNISNWNTAYGWGNHASAGYLTSLGIGSLTQAYDAELQAISGLSVNGIIVRTSASTAAARTITGTTNVISVTNGDGVSGNPTLDVGSLVARTDQAKTFTTSQRGTVTTDNDGSFDMNVTNNFQCTPTGTFALTFTNITSGQSGYVLLINTGGHAVTAAATTKVNASFLSTVSSAGTYLLSYFSAGGNVYVTTGGAMS